MMIDEMETAAGRRRGGARRPAAGRRGAAAPPRPPLPRLQYGAVFYNAFCISDPEHRTLFCVTCFEAMCFEVNDTKHAGDGGVKEPSYADKPAKLWMSDLIYRLHFLNTEPGLARPPATQIRG